MQPEFFTIGVYGSDEASFFDCLTGRGIDMFCDIRARRGVRGAKYAFVNSTYLQERLRELGIDYIHYKQLAPSKEIRNRQEMEDKRQKVKKRERQDLGAAFIEAYEAEYLAEFDSKAFIEELGPQAKKVVLFCVEREPDACHRSLIARKLSTDLNIQVEHLIP